MQIGQLPGVVGFFIPFIFNVFRFVVEKLALPKVYVIIELDYKQLPVSATLASFDAEQVIPENVNDEGNNNFSLSPEVGAVECLQFTNHPAVYPAY